MAYQKKDIKALENFIPANCFDDIFNYLHQYKIQLSVTPQRKSIHGNYQHNFITKENKISVNGTLNPYAFLVTLIHEIAHLVAFEKFGRNIKPHGEEWKITFQRLMVPFIRPEIFPHHLLPLLARHFRNPSASSDTDTTLSLALKQFDQQNDKNYVFEIPYGSVFRISNGKIFKKIAVRTKRFECLEISTGKTYLFNPNAEVELLKMN